MNIDIMQNNGATGATKNFFSKSNWSGRTWRAFLWKMFSIKLQKLCKALCDFASLTCVSFIEFVQIFGEVNVESYFCQEVTRAFSILKASNSERIPGKVRFFCWNPASSTVLEKNAITDYERSDAPERILYSAV